MREIKERIRKTKDEKKAKKAQVMANVEKTQAKSNVPKSARVPKHSGSGGKR